MALKTCLNNQLKLQTYHRVLLESLYGLHFPNSKSSHYYLSKIRTFSHKLKGDKFILVSNGLANVNTIVRKLPYKQAQHQLGTNSSEHYRELGTKTRSLTDPLRSFPSMMDKISATARKVTPTKIKIPKPGVATPMLSPISPLSPVISVKSSKESMKEPQKETSSSAGRKKRSSFIKVTRFFSWNR
ncbi:hypothetical protein K502DRAFT_120577 [Neoconidiobolus thromboides FSU 785]|nr:hypothetical protein K502DRAFT_120577 [Neoconidiobolus thromboides FSU 785]